MTTLLGQTLYTELSQELNYSSRFRLHIGSIAPYILINNSPAGTFTLTMTGDNGVVFSKSFTCADVKTAIGTTDNYIHAFYPLVPTNPVQISKGSFTLTLSSSGYTPTVSSFIAWVQQHEDIQNEMDYVPFDDTKNPLAVRFKSYKEGIH